MKTWQSLEERVRSAATHIWTRQCRPGRVAGVAVDAVVELRDDAAIYIEITEHDKLNKVRDDVIKLTTAKLSAASRGIFAQCYCVVDGNITEAMKEAGKAHFVQVITPEEFERQFYDFESYRHAREAAPFGSAVNPLTGRRDESTYVRVSYVVEQTGKEISVDDLAKYLLEGRHIVLIGEYGSGKSRCMKELFGLLSDGASDRFQYPIAINLRDCWGLKRAGEVIRRHYTDLGLEDMQSSAIKVALAQAAIFLLDGFDELGSQAWSNDDQRLRSIRSRSLEGIRDLIQKSDRGILVSGREHYFPNDEEMFAALGVDRSKIIVIRAKSEFSPDEMEEYFSQRGIDISIPSWLPRRPLICQTVVELSDADMASIFGMQGNEGVFWNHFVNVVARRDSLINPSFDEGTILQLLVYLARITRTKPTNVGPITLEDVQRAFELTVGKLPVEDASVMLQRLPSLGRIGSDSIERQFIDVAILDTLRARDVVQICRYDEDRLNVVAEEPWTNPLGDLGQRVASQSHEASRGEILKLAEAVRERTNRTLASDLISILTRGEGPPQDFKGIIIDDGNFSALDFSERGAENLTISDSVIHELKLPTVAPKNVLIANSLAGHVIGVSAAAGLPSWITGLQADRFDSAGNVAAIRRIGLSPPHEVLLTIIKKTFFQPGAGRKEEALLRGLGQISKGNMPTRVLAVLLRENILSKFRGDSGWVYAPERSQAGRMRKIVDELGQSKDPLWDEIGGL